MIVALAGRRVDSVDAAEPRFPASAVDIVRQRIAAAFEEVHAFELVSAAACGADLIAIDVAHKRGMPASIVLPYAADEFRRTSVVDRGEEWRRAYDAAIQEAESHKRLHILGLREGDAAYLATNEAILDEAVKCSGGNICGVLSVIVWDGPLHGRTDYTTAFAESSKKRGIIVRPVPILAGA
jgi:hypothetical protein